MRVRVRVRVCATAAMAVASADTGDGAITLSSGVVGAFEFEYFPCAVLWGSVLCPIVWVGWVARTNMAAASWCTRIRPAHPGTQYHGQQPRQDAAGRTS